jgi:hypothetical protein
MIVRAWLICFIISARWASTICLQSHGVALAAVLATAYRGYQSHTRLFIYVVFSASLQTTNERNMMPMWQSLSIQSLRAFIWSQLSGYIAAWKADDEVSNISE